MPLKEGFYDKALSFDEKQNTGELVSQYTHWLFKKKKKLTLYPPYRLIKGIFIFSKVENLTA